MEKKKSGPEFASQALGEGSIPFTRLIRNSSRIQDLDLPTRRKRGNQPEWFFLAPELLGNQGGFRNALTNVPEQRRWSSFS